ncbi:hypothetical protein U1Q18_009711 [Sarracenia purpurea var. burkii]
MNFSKVGRNLTTLRPTSGCFDILKAQAKRFPVVRPSGVQSNGVAGGPTVVGEVAVNEYLNGARRGI